jgi:tRNA dimethylallyltransferase
MSIPFFIIISGPTGVGKTAWVDELAQGVSFPIEVINADVGQLYTPLTIGTAKPDLVNVTVPHHMFNILHEPRDFTVTEYRARVLMFMEEICARGAVPVLVGGSGFYSASLFYPPEGVSENVQLNLEEKTHEELWKKLEEVDPVRAAQIHHHDRYRIIRALRIWYGSGILPSECQPLFDPPGRCAFYFLTRDRDELYRRIDGRTDEMFQQGWYEEVKALNEEWHTFLLSKKLIGYKELISYMQAESEGLVSDEAYEELRTLIAQKTRGYAKRQITFFKHLKKRLQASDPHGQFLLKLKEISLSSSLRQFFTEEIPALNELYLGAHS